MERSGLISILIKYFLICCSLIGSTSYINNQLMRDGGGAHPLLCLKDGPIIGLADYRVRYLEECNTILSHNVPPTRSDCRFIFFSV